MTDAQEKALWLLQFIEDSLQEGLKHPTTFEDCLTEADCALKVLRKHVKKDDVLNGLFFLSPLNNFRLLEIAKTQVQADRIEATSRGLEFIAATRDLLRVEFPHTD